MKAVRKRADKDKWKERKQVRAKSRLKVDELKQPAKSQLQNAFDPRGEYLFGR